MVLFFFFFYADDLFLVGTVVWSTASERQSFHCLEDLDKHIYLYICNYIQSPGILTVDCFQLSPSTFPLLSHFLFWQEEAKPKRQQQQKKPGQ